MACHFVWYDAEEPERGFSLGRVVARMIPEPGEVFPLKLGRIFAYAQLFGTPGEYELRLQLQRIALTELGEEQLISLGRDGEELQYGPCRIELFSDDYLFELAMPMPNVIFREAGDYELQLRVGKESDAEPIQTYRFRVQEQQT